MNWRVWTKLCCGPRWIVVLSPLLLLFLMIFVMEVTLPLPVPPADVDRRPSKALSAMRKLKPRVVELAALSGFQQPAPHIHSRTRRHSSGKEMSTHSALLKPVANSAGPVKVRSHPDVHNKKQSSQDMADVFAHSHRPDFTGNNMELQRRTKPSSHTAVVKHTLHTHTHLKGNVSKSDHKSSAADTIKSVQRAVHRHTHQDAVRQTTDSQTREKQNQRHTALERHGKAPKHSGKPASVGKEEMPSSDLREDRHLSRDDREAASEVEATAQQGDRDWCQGLPELDFLDADQRKIRVGGDLQHVHWLSRDDIEKMELLAGGEVVSKSRVPAHGQVLQVALGLPARHQNIPPLRDSQQHGAGHSGLCQRGLCSLVKRPDDWFEVFAFHLDRILGLNRSLPAVLRRFHDHILPYRFTDGEPRPAVWWDPDIQHLDDKDSDQNSVPLSWVQYQKLLQAQCGNQTSLSSEPCVGVLHAEWGRLALFDFLLQVNDRLDRNCCGFTPDPAELCVENRLNIKCGNSKELQLVHILVRKTDPSRLVFIDNAGRPKQSNSNLNFRLLEGIDEFPEKAVSVLRSGCLEHLLLRSLYVDKEFWESRGGYTALRPLVRLVEERGHYLLQHIRDKRIRLRRDL
ncbi:Golgi-associated kinase 1A [Poeciliopsis prolifica]|uniref:Golgi-associated kinase 1A n=1 Tax=Poeciliopsis prolifica TaxID=188132 RepID=UPI0024134A62|nr:Golgi-associated kinase 1A [Poeciliopsis prolifica]